MGIFPTVPSLAEFSDCHIAFLVLLIPCQMGTNLSSVHFCSCFFIIKSSGWIVLCFKPVGSRKIVRKRPRDQSALISALIFKQISNCLSVVVVLRRLHRVWKTLLIRILLLFVAYDDSRCQQYRVRRVYPTTLARLALLLDRAATQYLNNKVIECAPMLVVLKMAPFHSLCDGLQSLQFFVNNAGRMIQYWQ